MKRRLLLVVVFLTLLSGCASTPALDPALKQRLDVVSLNPTVDTPKDMYYLGPGSGFGMMFGAIGGLITAEANVSPGQRLQNFAVANGIHIDEIVKDEAAKAFRDSDKLNLTDSAGGNGSSLKITITMYGFSIPTGFSSDLVPILNIKCALYDANGKVVWSANDSTQPLGNPVDGRTPEEMRANPRLIEDMWRGAARSIMANIVKHM